MKIKKVKGMKIKNEKASSQFKEIKKTKEEESELEFDLENKERNRGSSESFSSGRRTAPVLQAETNLEQVAETAPTARTASNTAENTPAGNPYSANYTGNYSNTSYENSREDENWRTARIKAQRQEIGIGIGLTPVERSAQRTWNSSDAGGGNMQEQTRPVDNNYSPAEDRIKTEENERMARRRRVMG